MAATPGDLVEHVADPGLGQDAVDHLDQLQERHRVEEVIAGDAAGLVACRRDRRHRERRRVGREDAILGDDLLEAGEQLALDLEILDDRLDDEMRQPQPVHGIDDLDAADGGRPVVGADRALLGSAVDHPRDELLRTRRGARLGVEHLDPHAARGGDLRDAAAHGPSADDGDGVVGRLWIGGHDRCPLVMRRSVRWRRAPSPGRAPGPHRR